MRLLCLVLAGLLIALQFELWFGDVGLRRKAELETLAQQKAVQLGVLEDRNHALRAEVFRLKSSAAALEDRARYDLGMIKEDEVFYFVPGTAPPGIELSSIAPSRSAATGISATGTSAPGKIEPPTAAAQ